MSPRHERGVVLEETVSPQLTQNGVVYLCLPARFIANAGCAADELPDELALHYCKGGADDGTVQFDLKQQIADTDHADVEAAETDGVADVAADQQPVAADGGQADG